jgi:polyribonucleotide nucleotidyltransferase
VLGLPQRKKSDEEGKSALMQEFEKSISFDGRDIRLKVGMLAPQAGGSVLIQSGETAVLVTATRSSGREGIDFLPLLVDYEERL